MKRVPVILNLVAVAKLECHYRYVLFGDEKDPSGKLTATFLEVGQIPIYYSHKIQVVAEGKFEKFKSNYIDERNEPLFLWFWISYTFDYSNLKLSSDKMNFDGKISASVDVTNTGNYDGKEIVQLYTRDLALSPDL
jgi:beta-glucosidase